MWQTHIYKLDDGRWAAGYWDGELYAAEELSEIDAHLDADILHTCYPRER